MEYYYRPKRSCGKVMFLHLPVILFTGGCLRPLGRQTPPAQTPHGQTPPWADTPCLVHAGIHTPLPRACWDTVNKWAVRILLECVLVRDDSFTDTRARYLDLFFHLETFTRQRSNFHVLNTDSSDTRNNITRLEAKVSTGVYFYGGVFMK